MMTNKLLWMIAKLLIILIHSTYVNENLYHAYSRRLDEFEHDLTELGIHPERLRA